MNRKAEVIKQSLSMRQVAEFYGFVPDRSGFIRCPFHAGDRTASLKVYTEKGGGFYCFGCKAHGSVIDFVMRLFDCSFQSALDRLNNDFGLGLVTRSYREKKAARASFMAAQHRAKIYETKMAELERQYWAAFDLWRVADMMVIHYNPSETDGLFLPGFVEAVKSLPQLSYELTLAEERMREYESAAGSSELEERRLLDN